MSTPRDRAARRGGWPGRLATLATQTDAAIVRHGTPADRIAMVWQITRDAWALSGRPIPDYPRHAAPGRLIRSGDG